MFMYQRTLNGHKNDMDQRRKQKSQHGWVVCVLQIQTFFEAADCYKIIFLVSHLKIFSMELASQRSNIGNNNMGIPVN